MKTATTVARILLGLIFFVFGLNGFYTFIPVPAFHPFMQIIVSSGFIYVLKFIETIGGLFLLTNRFVLAGLILLGPVVVNILLYHILIDHRNWPIGIINLILYTTIVVHYWEYFKVFLKAKVD